MERTTARCDESDALHNAMLKNIHDEKRASAALEILKIASYGFIGEPLQDAARRVMLEYLNGTAPKST